MTYQAPHSSHARPHDGSVVQPALSFPEAPQAQPVAQAPVPVVLPAHARLSPALRAGQPVPEYVLTQLAAHGYHSAPSHQPDFADGLCTRDAAAWVLAKHVAQLIFCSLAVTLAIYSSLPIGVSIAWGLTGLVLLSVVTAADRVRFLESGMAYERDRFTVMAPAGHGQHQRPLDIDIVDPRHQLAAATIAAARQHAQVHAEAHARAVSQAQANDKAAAPFQVSVT